MTSMHNLTLVTPIPQELLGQSLSPPIYILRKPSCSSYKSDKDNSDQKYD